MDNSTPILWSSLINRMLHATTSYRLLHSWGQKRLARGRVQTKLCTRHRQHYSHLPRCNPILSWMWAPSKLLQANNRRWRSLPLSKWGPVASNPNQHLSLRVSSPNSSQKYRWSVVSTSRCYCWPASISRNLVVRVKMDSIQMRRQT